MTTLLSDSVEGGGDLFRQELHATVEVGPRQAVPADPRAEEVDPCFLEPPQALQHPPRAADQGGLNGAVDRTVEDLWPVKGDGLAFLVDEKAPAAELLAIQVVKVWGDPLSLVSRLVDPCVAENPHRGAARGAQRHGIV